MPPYDGRLLANLILDFADGEQAGLTNASVNKLLYFSHGLYLQRKGRRLVKNAFEAWEYGPVIPAVFEAFRSNGKNPISERAKKFSPILNQYVEFDADVAPADVDFVYRVWKTLGRFTAGELIDLSHEVGSPWHSLWEGDDIKVRPGMIITDSEILQHFESAHTV